MAANCQQVDNVLASQFNSEPFVTGDRPDYISYIIQRDAHSSQLYAFLFRAFPTRQILYDNCRLRRNQANRANRGLGACIIARFDCF